MDFDDAIVVEEGKWDGKGYYTPHICAFCHQQKAQGKGGPKCCEHFGCMYSTQDFIALRKGSKYSHQERLLIMTELLKQGRISIDMICGKDQNYGPLNVLTKRPDLDKISNGCGYLYLRARGANRPVVDLQFFMDGKCDYPCCNWNPQIGCRLPRDQVPTGGRWLNPILKECNGQRFCACEQMGEEELVEEWMDSNIQLLMYDLYIAVRDLNI